MRAGCGQEVGGCCALLYDGDVVAPHVPSLLPVLVPPEVVVAGDVGFGGGVIDIEHSRLAAGTWQRGSVVVGHPASVFVLVHAHLVGALAFFHLADVRGCIVRDVVWIRQDGVADAPGELELAVCLGDGGLHDGGDVGAEFLPELLDEGFAFPLGEFGVCGDVEEHFIVGELENLDDGFHVVAHGLGAFASDLLHGLELVVGEIEEPLHGIAGEEIVVDVDAVHGELALAHHVDDAA